MHWNDSDEEAAAGKSTALIMSQVDESNTSFASSSQHSSSSGQESESDQEEYCIKLNYKRKQGRKRQHLQTNKHKASHVRHNVHMMSEVQQLQKVTNQLQQNILLMSTFHNNVPDVVHFKVQDKVFAIEQRHLLQDVHSVLFLLTQEHYARQRQRQREYCLSQTAKRKSLSSSSPSTSILQTSKGKVIFVANSMRNTKNKVMQYDECNMQNSSSSSSVADNESKNCISSNDRGKIISDNMQHKECNLHKRTRDEHQNEHESSLHDNNGFNSSCTNCASRSSDNKNDKATNNTMSKWTTQIAPVDEFDATHSHCKCNTKQEEHESITHSSRPCIKKETEAKHDVMEFEPYECNRVEFIEIVDRDPNLFAMLINLLRGYKNAIPREWRDACRAEAEYYGLQKSFNACYPANDHYFFYCPLERPLLTSEMVCHYASPPLERGLHTIHFAIVQSDRVGVGVRRTDVSLDALMDSHDFTGTALLWNDGKVTTHFGVLESYFSGWAYSSPIVIDVELDLDANLVKWLINGEFDAAVHRLPSNVPFAFFVIAARNSQVKIVESPQTAQINTSQL